ncbi:MAG: flagellar hook-associated protein FlgL [Solirubrobacteraceae bacterium]
MSASRITSSMISRGVLADLNDISSRMTQTQRKMSSGKEITRPSDDPFGAGRALGLRTELEGLEQYQRNNGDAQAWTSVTDTALGTIGEIAARSRELLVRGASGTASQLDRNIIAQEIDQLIDAAKDTANATYAGRSLFAGTATTTKPYGTASDAYLGDGGDIVRTIGPGVSVVVNARGSAVLGDGTDGKMLNTLRDIAAHLRGGTPADLAALGGSDIVAVDKTIDDLLTVRAQVGTTAGRLDTAESRLAEIEEGVRGMLSKTEDADMAATIVDYSMQQSVYQSALRAGAGIIQSSLMDFLR